MTPIEQIRACRTRSPFEPFNITTIGGKVYMIRRPDALALPTDSSEIFIHQGDGIDRVSINAIVGAYPAEDVAAVALMEADTRGYLRGMKAGNRIGFWFGLVAGLLAGVTGSFAFGMWLITRR